MRNVILSSIAAILLSMTAGHSAEMYKYVSKPKYFDSEGTRGYSAVIQYKGGGNQKYEIISTCEYYDPAYGGYDVTVIMPNDEVINYHFKTVDGRFGNESASFSKSALEYYNDTCGKDKRFKKYLKNACTYMCNFEIL